MNPSSADLFFQTLIDSYTQENPRFLRRVELAGEIQKAVNDGSNRFILLSGAPLTGKSTLMAQLAEENPGWLRYFIRRDQRSPLGDPGIRSFLLQTGLQLAALHPDLFKRTYIRATVETIIKRVTPSGKLTSARINRVIASPFVQKILEVRNQVDEVGGEVRGLEVGEWVDDPRLLSPGDLAELALFQPARMHLANSGGLLVILVDALDELRYHPQPESLLEWLEGLGDFPENLRFVLSSREDEALLGGLLRAQAGRLQRIPLGEESAAAKDVRAYAAKLALEEAVQARLGEKSAEFIERAAAIAGSNLGYLDLLARAIDQALRQNDESQLQALLELRGLPDSLNGLYAYFLEQMRRSVEQEVVEINRSPEGEEQYLRTWPAVLKKVLSILTVARQPLKPGQLVALGGIQAREDYFQDCLLRMLQFLDTPAGRYGFFHTSLAEYLSQENLLDEPGTLAFSVRPATWHRQIADYYRTHFQDDWSGCDDYGLENTLYHLLNADLSFDELEDSVSGLLTEDFIDARGSHSGWHRPLVQDLYKLKDKLPVLVFQPCLKILSGSHRNSLANQEAIRLLKEVDRQFRYSPIAGARQGSKEWIIATAIEALRHPPERAMLALEALMEDTANVQMKGVIVLAMGETDAPEAPEKLLDILFETNKYVPNTQHAGHLGWCAADGLLALKEPAIVEPLLEKFYEPGASPWLRHRIVYVLGRMRADLSLKEKYRLLDNGLRLRQDCLPRVLDAIYLLAPSGGNARRAWSQRYQPYLLAGLGAGEPPPGIDMNPWTYPLTIKRGLRALEKIGTREAVAPMEAYLDKMEQREKAETFDEQQKRLLATARRTRDTLARR